MTPRFSLSKLAAPLLIASSLAISMPALASGTLNVATSQDPGSWDPIDTYLLAWSTVATNIFDGLTYRDTDLTLKPALATHWQELDNGDAFALPCVKASHSKMANPLMPRR